MGRVPLKFVEEITLSPSHQKNRDLCLGFVWFIHELCKSCFE